MIKWKEKERESKEVVREVYKREKENSFPFILKGKWFSIIGRVILPQGKNGFTLFCQPNNVKLKIEENILHPTKRSLKQIRYPGKWNFSTIINILSCLSTFYVRNPSSWPRSNLPSPNTSSLHFFFATIFRLLQPPLWLPLKHNITC